MGLPRPMSEPRGQESGKEGAVRGETRRGTSPGGSGGGRYGLQGHFCSKEAAAGPACRRPFPRGTVTQVLSGEGTLYALPAQPLGLA